MGREVRRVPPNWEHPKDEKGEFVPLFDKDFEVVAKEWIDGFLLWVAGKHPDFQDEPGSKYKFWEWHGHPPDPEDHPAFTEEPTWYQLYETVSEGTPLSPPFATAEELADWLVQHGDPWTKWKPTKEQAMQFVNTGWAPSMIVTRGPEGTTLKQGIQAVVD